MTRAAAASFAVFFLGTAAPLLAQETLSLEQVLAQTMAHNRSLGAARATADEAVARATEARAGQFPRVSFSESWQRGNQPVFVFSSLLSARRFAQSNFAIDALNSPDALGYFHGLVSVEQLLYDGGRTRATVSSALVQRDIATLAADEAASAIAVQATETYGRMLLARASERAAAAAIDAAQEDLARAERRRDAGTLSEADVLAVTVHLATVRQRRIQSSGDALVARAELNRLMGAPIDREFDVQDPPALRAPADLPPLAALSAEAETSRPDLQRLAAAERLADAGRRLSRAAWFPQVAAQAGYEVNGTAFADRASAWVVGGELRWSVSTGGAERARQHAAAQAALRAKSEREDAQAAAEVELIAAVRQLEAARARQAVGDAAVNQARESLRITRDRFDAGIASANDVLRASSSLLDAEAGRTSAVVDAMVADARLGRAVGRKPQGN
jgi:outer membrane protein TolC